MALTLACSDRGARGRDRRPEGQLPEGKAKLDPHRKIPGYRLRLATADWNDDGKLGLLVGNCVEGEATEDARTKHWLAAAAPISSTTFPGCQHLSCGYMPPRQTTVAHPGARLFPRW